MVMIIKFGFAPKPCCMVPYQYTLSRVIHFNGRVPGDRQSKVGKMAAPMNMSFCKHIHRILVKLGGLQRRNVVFIRQLCISSQEEGMYITKSRSISFNILQQGLYGLIRFVNCMSKRAHRVPKKLYKNTSNTRSIGADWDIPLHNPAKIPPRRNKT